MASEEKILQIMPADEWFAIQNDEDDDESFSGGLFDNFLLRRIFSSISSLVIFASRRINETPDSSQYYGKFCNERLNTAELR